MKRILSSKFVAAALIAVASLGAASAAQARPDIQFSIGLPGLPGLPIFLPPPVIVRAEPVYVEPRPVYVPPQVVYERPERPAYGYGRDWRHDEWKRREWERREWERREWQRREWERRQHHRSPSQDHRWD